MLPPENNEHGNDSQDDVFRAGDRLVAIYPLKHRFRGTYSSGPYTFIKYDPMVSRRYVVATVRRDGDGEVVNIVASDLRRLSHSEDPMVAKRAARSALVVVAAIGIVVAAVVAARAWLA